jgi:membrane protein implicated in regulation of membrane protease activity
MRCMFGVVHIGLAAGATVISLWAADVAPVHKVLSLWVGVMLGTWAGSVTVRTLERRLDAGGGLVMYTDETSLFALVLPLSVLGLSPFAFGTMVVAVAGSAQLQVAVQVILCGLSSVWLAHDLVVARGLRRLRDRVGPLHVQWFHGRSTVGPEGMIGKNGIVTAQSGPTGYIRVAGELWRAQSIDGSPLSVGQTVRVRRLNGLVLLIEGVAVPESSGT